MFDIDYILVPVDFSRSSRAALTLARSLANDQTKLEVVHVVDRWPRYMEAVLFPYAPLGEDAPQIEHELVETARSGVLDFHALEADTGEKKGGPDEATTVVYGPAKSTLVDHAKSTAANVVVMGAFGEGGTRYDAIGSLAEHVARHSNSTTLLVREFAPAPKVSKVLVAIDLSGGSRRVLQAALGLALRSGAELEIIHVIPDPLHDDHSQVLASVLKFDPKTVSRRARDRVEALFEQLMTELRPGFADEGEIHRLVRRRKVTLGEPAATIASYADEIGADLVVVGTRDPSRPTGHFGRVANTLARRCPTHLAIVPVPDSSRSGDD